MAQQTHGAHMGGPRGAAGMMPGEKAKNFKGTMAKRPGTNAPLPAWGVWQT